jgi:hypothetical protein
MFLLKLVVDRGIQEDNRSRWRVDLGTYHLRCHEQTMSAPCDVQYLRWIKILSCADDATLYVNVDADLPNIARSPRHSWSRAI